MRLLNNVILLQLNEESTTRACTSVRVGGLRVNAPVVLDILESKVHDTSQTAMVALHSNTDYWQHLCFTPAQFRPKLIIQPKTQKPKKHTVNTVRLISISMQ